MRFVLIGILHLLYTTMAGHPAPLQFTPYSNGGEIVYKW